MNEITKNEGFQICLVREVLWRDLDALNHMNNVTSLYYFEDARVQYWKRLAESGLQNWNAILAHVECDYVSQAVMGEKLVVALKTAQFGKRSFRQEYLISELESSRVVSRGKSVSVCFKYSEGESCDLTPDIIECIEKLEGRKIPRS